MRLLCARRFPFPFSRRAVQETELLELQLVWSIRSLLERFDSILLGSICCKIASGNPSTILFQNLEEFAFDRLFAPFSTECSVDISKISRYNRLSGGGGGAAGGGGTGAHHYNGRIETVDEDDEDGDGETYFAYSSDDMLTTKVAAGGSSAGGGSNDSATTSGFGGGGGGGASNSSSSSSQVAETSIPNFLLKLWKLVEDDRYNQCIEWDQTGFSFHVREPYGFSKDVLPLYFKHSNLNSFIRQLNMYGFRKVTNLEKGALKQQMDQDSLEFQHPYFVRGHPELLQYIKRKISNPRSAGELEIHQPNGNARGMNQVLEDLRQLRDKQFGMDARLNHVKKENGTLWREVAHMRQLHMKQQQVVNKLIQFLLSLVQPAAGKRLGKRQLLAIGPGLLGDQLSQQDDQGGKRSRADGASPANAVNIIESLEQELQNSARFAFANSARSPMSGGADGGPIIADVTDEPEHRQPDMSGATAPPSSICGMQPPNMGGGGMTPGHSSGGGYHAPPVGDSDISIVGESLAHGSAATSRTMGDWAVPPNGLIGYNKDGDSPYGNLTVLSSPCQPKPISPQQPAQLQPQPNQPQQQLVQRQQPHPRMLLNRSISECDSAAPAAVYSAADWSLRGNTASEGEQRWAKPEFSEYLDFVQTDLDSLRDFLSSGSFSTMDQDSLSNLFTMVDESNTLATSTQSAPVAEIVGNEVQVYKRPEILVNFDGTARPDGYNASSAISSSASSSSAMSSPVNAVPAASIISQAISSQRGLQHPPPVITSMQQQQHSTGGMLPTRASNEQMMAAVRLDQQHQQQPMPGGSMIGPPPNSSMQSAFVTSTSPSLHQGNMRAGLPTSSSQLLHHPNMDERRGSRGKDIERR